MITLYSYEGKRGRILPQLLASLAHGFLLALAWSIGMRLKLKYCNSIWWHAWCCNVVVKNVFKLTHSNSGSLVNNQVAFSIILEARARFENAHAM